MAKIFTVLTVAALLSSCFCGVRPDESPEVRSSLVGFLTTLAGGDAQVAQQLGWNAAVNPCNGTQNVWLSVTCNNDSQITGVVIEDRGLNGTINATALCAAPALRVLSLHGNALRGGLAEDISACNLHHIYLQDNRLSGSLPDALAQFRRLAVLDVSRNNFSGELPAGLSSLGNLVRFLANDNHFDGGIPDMDLRNFTDFSVSDNNLTGPIPEHIGSFRNDSFWPNGAGICGQQLFSPCPETLAPPSSSSEGESKSGRTKKIVMILGYVLLGTGILAFVLYKLCKKKKSKMGKKQAKVGAYKDTFDSSDPTMTTTASKSAYSLPASADKSEAAGGAPSTSLVVLKRSGTASVTSAAAAAAAKNMRFEDLLKSPAELLGRGRFGSSYKVVVAGGAALAVKRVKDATVTDEVFRRRMERVAVARHPAVLPPLAFYCAVQEKLVVYEFQSNGSLAKLLHGSIESSQGPLDWSSRLNIAAKVAEGMVFMHGALRGDEIGNYSSSASSSGDGAAAADGPIAHGNLKATNILFTASMEPCISEYGVIVAPPPAGDGGSPSSAHREDVRAFGVLLLELLTGKASVAQGDGAELARWVTAVIQEEWTAEVFDRGMLAGDGFSEQRMVQLLQVAMRCVEATPGEAPPTMREVAGMINAIREEDDRSLSVEA